jgi:hypothetical protein
MKLTDFKILSFDCYGTLIDWESGLFSALQPLVAKASLANPDRPFECCPRAWRTLFSLSSNDPESISSGAARAAWRAAIFVNSLSPALVPLRTRSFEDGSHLRRSLT